MKRLLGILRTRATTAPRARGFTLLELLVVIAILGLLAAIVGPQVLHFFSGAKSNTAQIQIRNIESSIETYQLDNGHTPTQDEGLRALIAQPAGETAWNGPYLQRPEALTDPWGRPYLYKVPGTEGRAYDVYTLGADNAPGGSGEDRDLRN